MSDRTYELWAALMKGELEPDLVEITSADVNRALRKKAEDTWGNSSQG